MTVFTLATDVLGFNAAAFSGRPVRGFSIIMILHLICQSESFQLEKQARFEGVLTFDQALVLVENIISNVQGFELLLVFPVSAGMCDTSTASCPATSRSTTSLCSCTMS